MKTYTYKESANIGTTNQQLEVGEIYCYKESSFIGECQFLADESDDEYWKWRFKWSEHPFELDDQSEFVCSEKKNSKFFYSGMMHILNRGSYVKFNKPSKK